MPKFILCSLKSIKHNERLKCNSSNLGTSVFSSKVPSESSFQGETNLGGLIGDINSYNGHKRINELACFNAFWVFSLHHAGNHFCICS